MKKILLSILLPILFLGCTTRPPALPDAHAHKLPWGAIDLDINSKDKSSIKNSLGSILTQKANRYSESNGKVPFDILTLTGGGSRGAFGTGLLIGWTKKGDIPNFDIVTGISTGAVMAPFIFLGKDELKKVEYFYTKMHTDDIFERSWTSFFGYGYIMNAKPLKKLFKRTFDKAFLDKVALEHKKGRRLYIGTTNIDTGQLIVWDMGAIASSDKPDKYQRFCDIVYASSALPIYLPPQYIKVEADGQDYYQMHIDGGIYSQVFMIGLLVNWGEVLDFKKTANTDFDVTLYTVSNRKYRQRDIYKPVEQAPFSIIEAYVLTEMDLLFDRSVYRLYSSCKKKGFKFKMATIPEKMTDVVIEPTEFNSKQMTKLYNIGYQLGKNHVEWKEKISFDEYDNNR
ncbi:phospholipase, patatin-family [Sulfurimonas gotlandica GD1]|uniref:Phospholipase, patatin-family n=1 Tax=Sulfurimonas gotlandica (strain DSM 19862 / JCM 16533 / GD1) TaxID=929558 RepID=B6BJM6_SULGG|nr:patatin-like phospholipase family protein [Sulfurimonas gotlandica]EDZ62752.1 patatin [Sulfurimonas gotlandica GD1]EHP31271.1 phospholipase, patatin-family [Sulfurimonas gotlandica GD1]